MPPKDEQRRDYIELKPHLHEIKDDIKAILKILNGNGSIGLVAKVQVLWATSLFLVVTVIGIIGKWVVGAMKGS